MFFASSGPGETSTVLTLMKVAKAAGATNLLVTAAAGRAARRSSPISCLLIPAQTMANDQGAAKTSVLPMGSVFEGALFLLFEMMVLKLKDTARRVARGHARAPHQHGIADALRTHAAAPDPQGDRGELAGGAAARRARISRRAHGRRHGHAGRHQDAGADRAGDGPRHPAAFLLRRGELCGRAAGRQRLGAGRRQRAGAVRRGAVLSACCGSASATSTRSSITRPRISPRACRPTWRSRSAGRQAIFRFIETERGEGWWGNEKIGRPTMPSMRRAANPFNWVQVHPLMSPEIMANYPFDHAGQGETSLMLALCPEAVDMAQLRREHRAGTRRPPRMRRPNLAARGAT